MKPEAPFSRLLRERRLASGLTQAELAVLAGCTTLTVIQIECGILRPSIQVAGQLAEALNIPPRERPAFTRLIYLKGFEAFTAVDE